MLFIQTAPSCFDFFLLCFGVSSVSKSKTVREALNEASTNIKGGYVGHGLGQTYTKEPYSVMSLQKTGNQMLLACVPAGSVVYTLS